MDSKKLCAVVLAILLSVLPVAADVQPTNAGARAAAGTVVAGTPFVGQVQGPAADNCTAPPYSFSGDLNTGVCTASTDNLSLRTAGANQLTVNVTSVTTTVPVLTSAGTAAAPALGWLADADGSGTGLFRNGANFIAVSTNGAAQSMWLASSYQMRSDGDAQWCPTTALGCSPDTGLARSAAGVVRVTNGSTSTRMLLGGGAAVASAATLPIPTGNVFHVTGTTNITGGITATNLATGLQITLIFDGVLTVSSGGNLIIVGGTMVTTANDTLTLIFDGTSFFEIARTAL